jgi:hypothetical protein
MMLAGLCLSVGVCGCSDESSVESAAGGSGGTAAMAGSGGSAMGGSSGSLATAGSSGSSGSAGTTLCAKYGGADAVAGVIKNQVIGEVAADCRISAFFTTLSVDGLTRVSDCLAIQAQELFGCPGVTYTGASASNGLPCRSMAAAHAGLAISDGDFMALLEDVAAGLGNAGVEDGDIAAAAPALMGLKPDIVENSATAPTHAACDAGGAGDGGA